MSNRRKKTSPINILLKLPYLLFFPMALILVDVAKSNPAIVESIYSTRLYPILSRIFGILFGWVTFSFAEIFIILLVVLIPVGLIVQIARHRHAAYHAINYVVSLLCAASILYFLFIGVWGLNYYRLPLGDTLGYDVRDSSTQELVSLCESLISDANELRIGLDSDEAGVLILSTSIDEVMQNVNDSYEDFSANNPTFRGVYSTPKKILLSEKMCYTEITGIFIPFTAEANVNVAIMPMSLASTAAHEAAHQRGIAKEDEANFLSYLVCRDYGDRYMQYSGTMLALTHSMNALSATDVNLYRETALLYEYGVSTDLKADYLFWQQYKGKIADAAKEVNNTYLVSNNQEDGTKSYGRMVDLLLAERRYIQK